PSTAGAGELQTQRCSAGTAAQDRPHPPAYRPARVRSPGPRAYRRSEDTESPRVGGARREVEGHCSRSSWPASPSHSSSRPSHGLATVTSHWPRFEEGRASPKYRAGPTCRENHPHRLMTGGHMPTTVALCQRYPSLASTCLTSPNAIFRNLQTNTTYRA